MTRFNSAIFVVAFSFIAMPSAQAVEWAILSPTGNVEDIPAVSVVDKTENKDNAVKAKVGTALRGCTVDASSIQRKAGEHLDSITKYATKYGVDANIVKAVIAIESCYNSKAVSPMGAQGLMQLIPETAARFGVADSFNTSQNIHGGTRYLSWLMKRYNGDLHKSIAAYNAGEGAVDKYQGIPPYNETQQYVRKVLAVYNGLSGQAITLPVVSTSGKVSGKQASQQVKVKTHPVGKPGRSGWAATKAMAPQLFKH
ncbi:lytic transglycosylase domain-containing protein [Thiothrix lacustris]|uniref:Lytic transglycosylase domain-containing protein n=1 Tax=Thiothrix lacustris TaxID=525917 RepID=A0ABY9MP14_9GAMM|nr:lytic transglycosylase domain-containing protein [Thiothrix lacustris]WML90302.1 lytic transglycosylase domain-containing protein [Thiothrix lacustris]WMP16902.1 lytic transglycosylase domain-containing protein [Thiothrix lacustris]